MNYAMIGVAVLAVLLLVAVALFFFERTRKHAWKLAALPAALLVVASGAYVAEDGGLHEQSRLVYNTESCSGGHCEAIFTINATASNKTLQRNINVFITFEDKEHKNKTVKFHSDFEVYHYEMQNVTGSRMTIDHNETYANGSVIPVWVPINVTAENLVRVDTGKKLQSGVENYVRIYTDDFDESWVDWHVLIKGITKEVLGVSKDVDFDTHNKGWAVWTSGEDSSTFGYYRNVTVNSNVASTLTDFPVMFQLDTASLVSAGKMQSDCDDLRVLMNSTTLLSYEIENGTCNTATTTVHVKVPSLSSTGYNLTVFYGNSSVSSKQNVYDVWSNGYQRVYHASEPSWTGVAVDSSGHANATYVGTGSFSTGTASCHSGRCWNFNNNSANRLTTTITDEKTTPYTLTAWFNVPSTASNPYNTLIGENAGDDWYMYVSPQVSGTTYNRIVMAISDTSPYQFLSNDGVITPNTLQFASFSSNSPSAQQKIGTNGVITNTATLVPNSGTPSVIIGSNKYSHAFYGTMDEWRWANVYRSDDWIKAEYAQTFSIGGEQANTPSSSPPTSIYAVQNLSDMTFNHNGTPQIMAVKWNVTNSSPACVAINISSNDSAHPIDNRSGWINLTGPNISATGFSWVNFTAKDNCSNQVTNIVWINITNPNAPVCAALVNETQYSGYTITRPLVCTDADNDAITFSDNSTAVSINSTGNVSYYVLNGSNQFRFTATDTLLSSIVDWNVTGFEKGSRTSYSLCSPIPRLRFVPNGSLIVNGRTTQMQLANGTRVANCTISIETNGELGTIFLMASNNYSSSQYVLNVGGINLTAVPQNITTMPANTVTKLNISGYWNNASATMFPFALYLDYY